MRTAILILSVDEAPLLAYSLPAAAVQDDADLYVIDNACTDGTVDLALSHDATVIHTGSRLSYAEAMNAGLAAIDAPAVLLLNADCFLAPDFLERARPHLERDGVGSVAGKLLRVKDPLAAPDAIDAAGMVVDRRRKNTIVGHGEPVGAYAFQADCFGPDGACALYRREVLDAWAPEVFDTDMALWATDADLAWRARLQGWRCVYEPAAVGRHIRTFSPSTRPTVSEDHRRLQFRNRYLMWVKNETRDGLRRDLLRIAVYELGQLAYVLLRERYLLRGYREALAALPGARRRRRAVQGSKAGVRVPFGLRTPS